MNKKKKTDTFRIPWLKRDSKYVSSEELSNFSE